MLHRSSRLIVLAFAAVAAIPVAEHRIAPSVAEVADGVFLFSTPPYGDVGLDGNSVAVIGGDGVLVFDSNGTPAAAAAVLSGIRHLTSLPVKYVVNSHWHWDHWYGTEVYQQAFPDVRIVAHEKTRELMMGPALEFNRPGIETELPRYIAALEKRLEVEERSSPPGSDVLRLRELVAEDRFFLDQKAHVHHTFPGITFSNRLQVFLGTREVRILHYDRAVTPGDAFVYLPQQKVVLTGDLLVNPIPFALDCYPSAWLRTLERIDALDVNVFVPGHGPPLHDRALLHTTIDLFRKLIAGASAAKARGLDVHQARESLLPTLHDSMVALTAGDRSLDAPFRVQLVDWFLHRAYEELDGPLSDDIAPIPAS